MAKEQTHITRLEDIEGNVIDFERWSYKRDSTVERNVRSFYKNCNYIVREAIKKGATKLSIYRTDSYGCNYRLIKTIDIKELLIW